MRAFIVFGSDGYPFALYSDDLYPGRTDETGKYRRHPSIPAEAFEITLAQRAAVVGYHGALRLIEGQIVEAQPPVID